MSSLNGFIKLHRKLVAWGWYQDDIVKSTFLHILLNASFKESEWGNITLRPGQLVTSVRNLAKELGHSEQQTRTALKKLNSTHEITIKATNKFSVITVVNWEEYQLYPDNSNTQVNTDSNNQSTNKQHTEQQHRKNIKNVKNVNIKKEKIKKEKSGTPSPLMGEASAAELPQIAIEAGYTTWEEWEAFRNQ